MLPFTSQNLDHLQWSNNNRKIFEIQGYYENNLLTWQEFAGLCEYSYIAHRADTTWSPSHSHYATLCTQSKKKKELRSCVVWSQGQTRPKSRCGTPLPRGLHPHLIGSSEDCGLLSQQGSITPERPRPAPPRPGGAVHWDSLLSPVSLRKTKTSAWGDQCYVVVFFLVAHFLHCFGLVL